MDVYENCTRSPLCTYYDTSVRNILSVQKCTSPVDYFAGASTNFFLSIYSFVEIFSGIVFIGLNIW